MSGEIYVGAVPVRGQLSCLDRFVAARGSLNAASKQGPDAFRAAVDETDSAVTTFGDEGDTT